MPIVQFETINTPVSDIIYKDCKGIGIDNITNTLSGIATVMPFRIKFQTVDIGAYSPTNPAPIGIAIIGFNNYIL